MQEKVVEIKSCKQCNSSFEITDKDLEFYDKISPVFSGKKYNIPTPTLCPDCRNIRRLTWRNERKLYKRKCDFNGKDIISIYSPDKQYKVYEQEIWWSDKWDASSYGKDFDFSKSFFEQFNELMIEVPRINLHSHLSNENSDYTNYFVQSKNCYLCFGGGYCEDVYFSSFPIACNDSMELFFCNNCENCYEVSHSNSCYKLMFSDNCTDCSNSYFLDSCNGCKNCFACYGLNNKEYYIFNKKSTKEEFNNIIEKYKKSNVDAKKINEQIKEFQKNTPVLFTRTKNSIDCIGDYINDSKNCSNCFNIDFGENIKYSNSLVKDTKNIYDTFGSGINLEMLYEVMTSSMGLYKVLFSSVIRENCNNIAYSIDIASSSNLFGCIGLKNKEYCILNKLYTKEEYETLVPKIIEHMKKNSEWGEFFPSSISPFGYNETVANELIILNKNEVLKKGFKWSTYEQPFPKLEKIISANKLPENIKDIPDDILNWAIMPDENVGNADLHSLQKPFKIIKQELEFYRKYDLPIPKRHPDQRHLDRMKLRNPKKLWDRKCNKCGVDMKTTYSKDRKEIIYCEGCYNKEFY